MKQDEFNFDRKDYVPYKAASVKQMLEDYDAKVKDAIDAMTGTSDADMLKPWKMTMDGQPLFEMPRVAVLRSMMFNHSIHHRAQLGVYLRMLDIPVPALYGPSADEQG